MTGELQIGTLILGRFQNFSLTLFAGRELGLITIVWSSYNDHHLQSMGGDQWDSPEQGRPGSLNQKLFCHFMEAFGN